MNEAADKLDLYEASCLMASFSLHSIHQPVLSHSDCSKCEMHGSILPMGDQ